MHLQITFEMFLYTVDQDKFMRTIILAFFFSFSFCADVVSQVQVHLAILSKLQILSDKTIRHCFA